MDRKIGLVVIFMGVSPFAEVLASAESDTARETYRAMMIDSHSDPGAGRTSGWELLLINLSDGTVIARAPVGRNPDFCISRDRRYLAILSDTAAGPKGGTAIKLTILNSLNLEFVHDAEVAIRHRARAFPFSPNWPLLCISPDNHTVVIPHFANSGGQRRIPGLTWTPFHFVAQREGSPPSFEQDERFKAVATQVAGRTPVLSTVRWPEIDVADRVDECIRTFDMSTGIIIHELHFDEADGQIPIREPAIGARLRASYPGRCVATASGRRAFWLPEGRGPGVIKEVDLSVGLPRIVNRGTSKEATLNPFIAAASDSAGVLCVAELTERQRESGTYSELPRVVRIYDTKTLLYESSIQLDEPYSLLHATGDGRKFIAVSNRNKSITIIDTRARSISVKYSQRFEWCVGFSCIN